MGRAIVRDPQVFLFDEPLSNLDAKLRVAMRSEIKELHQRLKTTSIYVTHDQIEAMTMGDKIVVMRDGRIEQTGSAARALRPPGQPVRRRLHRLAGDELPARHAAPQRRRGAASSSTTARSSTAPLQRRRQRRPAGRLRHPARAPAAGRATAASPSQVVVVEPTGADTFVACRHDGTELSRGVPRAPRLRARQHDPPAARPAARASVRCRQRPAAGRLSARPHGSRIRRRLNADRRRPMSDFNRRKFLEELGRRRRRGHARHRHRAVRAAGAARRR